MSPNSLTLTTIPPELLLTIISHLPSSNSLYALSSTSHFFATFLHIHAATICNTRILQHHSQAAEILKSNYVDGWLIPKHPCIIETEEQWQHERSSRSVSRASSPPRGTNLTNCCFRTSSSGSNSSNDRAPRPRLRSSLPIRVSTHRHDAPLSPSSQPLLQEFPPVTRHTDPSLSLTLGLPEPFKLSRPGPHYLVFLERYSVHIVARWEMDIGSKPIPINHPKQEQDDSGSDSEETDEAYFESRYYSTIRLHCIRSWLVYCHNTFVHGSGNGVRYSDITHYNNPREIKQSKRTIILDSAKEKLTSFTERSKSRFRKLRQVFEKQKPKAQPTRRLLFGEIDSDSASSLASAQRGEHLSSRDTTSSTLVERDHWVKGLLWFYGMSSHSCSADISSSEIEYSSTSAPSKESNFKTAGLDEKCDPHHHQVSTNNDNNSNTRHSSHTHTSFKDQEHTAEKQQHSIREKIRGSWHIWSLRRKKGGFRLV